MSFLCIGIGAYIILVMLEMGTVRSIKQIIFKTFKQIYTNNGMETIDSDVDVEQGCINQMDLSAVIKCSGAIKR